MSKCKRILTLILCSLLIVSMLVGCGESLTDESQKYVDENELPPAKEYVTLNLYIPTEVQIDDTTVSQMQMQFNRIIEAKYQTRVVFHMVNATGYEAAVLERKNYAAENADTPLDKTPASVNDKYPQENAHQFDIFVATGKKMVEDYVKAGALADLTSPLTTTYNSILSNRTSTNAIPAVIYDNSYISSTGDDGNTSNRFYGVPANFMIDQYEYYIIDKAKADELYFEFTDVLNTPLETRINRLKAAITDAGYVESEVIQTIEGNYGDRFAYPSDAYYVEVKKAPTFNPADAFEGMFCIASTCRYQDRALEVIAELFTNTALHTVLQYGAENVTYRLKDATFEELCADGSTRTVSTKVVELIDGAPAYKLNVRYTGNIRNLYACDAYLTPKGESLSNEYLNYVYLQNLEAQLQTQAD